MTLPLTGRASAQSVEVDIAAVGYDINTLEEGGFGFSNLQSQKKEALSKGFLADQSTLREQIKTKHAALRQELSLEDPDQAQLHSMAHEILAVQEKLIDNRIDYLFKLRGILTPEQRKKLYAIRTESQAKLKVLAEERVTHHHQKKMKEEKAPPLSATTDILPHPDEKKK